MSNEHKALNWLINTNAGFLADAPILPPNYRALESDTGAVKQGDGSTAYSSLVNNFQPGRMVTKVIAYTENATSTIHTGTVAFPAGSWPHNIQVLSQALWTAGTAVMKVGDTADDDGYFVGVDLKATDLLVGEVLDTTPSTSWGGKEGAYLVAATGRRGPVTDNFAKYYAAGSNITGIITVGTPATTVGRTFMLVTYSLGDTTAATTN